MIEIVHDAVIIVAIIFAVLLTILFTVEYIFTTSKNVYVDTNTNRFYKKKFDKCNYEFYRPIKKFLFMFIYTLDSDVDPFDSLISYREWKEAKQKFGTKCDKGE